MSESPFASKSVLTMRSPEPKEKLTATPMSKKELERLKKRKRNDENDNMSDENEKMALFQLKTFMI